MKEGRNEGTKQEGTKCIGVWFFKLLTHPTDRRVTHCFSPYTFKNLFFFLSFSCGVYAGLDAQLGKFFVLLGIPHIPITHHSPAW
jgi:hypothetical protein